MSLFARKPKHHHEYEILRVIHGRYVLLGGNATTVYEKCSCGALRYRTLDGTWYPEDFE
jgi:hypothetical protein